MAPAMAEAASFPTRKKPTCNDIPRKTLIATLAIASPSMRWKIIRARSKNGGKESTAAAKTGTPKTSPPAQDHDNEPAIATSQEAVMGDDILSHAAAAFFSVEDAIDTVMGGGHETVPPSSSSSTIDLMTDNVPSIIDKDSPTLSATNSATVAVVPTSRPVENTFPNFKKLPLEIRLMVWGRVRNKGIHIFQTESYGKGNRWSFSRSKIPAVLHACKESRNEYLEKEGDTEESISSKRKLHAVYKLSVADIKFPDADSRPSLALIDPTIDSFWGKAYPSKNSNLAERYFSSFSGIADLDIASALVRLVIPYKNLRTVDIGYLPTKFPKLKCIVALVGENEPLNRAFFNGRFKAQLRAEQSLGRAIHEAGVEPIKFLEKDCEGILKGHWAEAALKCPIWYFKFPSQMLEFRHVRF